MDAKELSGVELARAVGVAVGWEVVTTNIVALIRRVSRLSPWYPYQSADYALEALEALNARGWIVALARQIDHGGWLVILSGHGSVHGEGDTFPEALSRAILAAKAAEEARDHEQLGR